MSDKIISLGLPPLNGGYYRFGNKYRIGNRGVFVYGSNLRGANGAGAALYAARAFGAHYGRGEGFSVNKQPDESFRARCYALPTKDLYIRTLSIEQINQYAKKFIEMTEMNTLDMDPYWFYMTPVGTGLAGYSHEEIAPLFKLAIYCWFPDVWRPYLGDKPYHPEDTE